MDFYPRILIAMIFSLPASAVMLQPHPLARTRPRIVDKPSPALTATAAAALESFIDLKIFQKAVLNICYGGAQSWAKVYAAQTAYRDVGRAVYEIGDECADVGTEDVLGLQAVIPARIRRLKKSEEYKTKCWEAWFSRITIEKEFINGPEKIIDFFQANCYSKENTNSGGSATR